MFEHLLLGLSKVIMCKISFILFNGNCFIFILWFQSVCTQRQENIPVCNIFFNFFRQKNPPFPADWGNKKPGLLNLLINLIFLDQLEEIKSRGLPQLLQFFSDLKMKSKYWHSALSTTYAHFVVHRKVPGSVSFSFRGQCYDHFFGDFRYFSAENWRFF
jgi:hypothetical protein